jgi:hypothetical protein
MHPPILNHPLWLRPPFDKTLPAFPLNGSHAWEVARKAYGGDFLEYSLPLTAYGFPMAGFAGGRVRLMPASSAPSTASLYSRRGFATLNAAGMRGSNEQQSFSGSASG